MKHDTTEDTQAGMLTAQGVDLEGGASEQQQQQQGSSSSSAVAPPVGPPPEVVAPAEPAAAEREVAGVRDGLADMVQAMSTGLGPAASVIDRRQTSTAGGIAEALADLDAMVEEIGRM
jgi:hypothetical protein